jgi:hypothetical protein
LEQGERKMKKYVSYATIFIILILAVGAATVSAKGPPEKVSIIGPGIESEIEVTDPDVLMTFSFYGFNNMARRTSSPKVYGEGYAITRYIKSGDDLRPWDRVTYYPNLSGESGLVFFDGLLQLGMSTEGQGYWYRATEMGDKVMGEILAEVDRKITLSLEETPGAELIVNNLDAWSTFRPFQTKLIR